MTQEIGTILGVKVNSTTTARVLRFVRNRIFQGKKFFIVTPNPEIVMRAEIDEDLNRVLEASDLSLPDGIGLVAARKFLKLPNPKNPFKRALTLFAQGLGVGISVLFNRKWVEESFNLIKGREMFMELIKLANKKGWRVYLLGGENQVAQKSKETLKRSFKKVKIKADQGPLLTSDAKPRTNRDKEIEKKSIKRINKFKPHLLFVAFKFPRQEKWIEKYLGELKVGGAMVVGGTFDYVSGHAKLPPTWLEEIGLEWLWRLINDPKRIKRIINATAVFSLKVFLYKLNNRN
ncbi:WecB/TagA/CpsF family glycosyltransferase [Patescibacteria group bacterium]|nr:WecB/TagA/CpsF family glycosyltransferase [Patescibacteria group bacterium]